MPVVPGGAGAAIKAKRLAAIADDVIPTNNIDEAAQVLAEKIGGAASVKIRGFGDREFDAVSRSIVAQTTNSSNASATGRALRNFLNKSKRAQFRATFQAAKKTGRQAVFEFTGSKPSDELIAYIQRNAEKTGLDPQDVVIVFDQR